VPDALKPRRIEIGTAKGPTAVQDNKRQQIEHEKAA
jgi:hypothetical protein